MTNIDPKLKKLVDDYLAGAQNSIDLWEMSLPRARQLELAAKEQFLDEVRELGLDLKEAKELWVEVVVNIGINDQEYFERYYPELA